MIFWLWRLILITIFIRPFVYEITFPAINLTLNTLLIVLSILYFSKKKIMITSFDTAILIFFAGILLMLPFSNNLPHSLIITYQYLSLFSLYFLIRAANKHELYLLVLTLILSTTFIAAYSLRVRFTIIRQLTEYFSTNESTHPFSKTIIEQKRAFAPFISPNLLANYLAMNIMLCTGLLIQKIKDSQKDMLTILYIFSIGISLITLFFTKSIGGWITLLIGTCFFISAGKLFQKRILFPAAFIFLSLLCILIYLRTKKAAHFTSLEFSFSERLDYWKQTINIIKKRPLTGIGIGNLLLEKSLFAHNSYLQIWAEMGLFALLGWLGIIGLFIKKAITKIKTKNASYYYLGISSGVLLFLIHNTIDYSFFIPQAAYIWWILIGLSQNNTYPFTPHKTQGPDE